MGVKKTKELSFAFKDRDGKLRSVVFQVQHQQDGAEDRIKVQVFSEQAPVDVEVYMQPKVKRGRARA